MNARQRHNISDTGVPDGPVIMFAHGFGCDQNMWRFVAPSFEDRYRVICFDHVGSGGARAPYDPERYATLSGYADDVVRICDELDLRDVVFVGHSVAAMIGVLADRAAPGTVARHVMVGPSPRYLDDEDYVGGFTAADIEGLLDSLASNYLGWSRTMAPVIMGNSDRPALGSELVTSFCRMDPEIAAGFARATFTSDNRADLAGVSAPTLVLQCRDDVIAPEAVGRYVADTVQRGELVLLDATGHCPNLSAPVEVVEEIEKFLARSV